MINYTKTQKNVIAQLIKAESKSSFPENYKNKSFLRRQVIVLAPNLLEVGITEILDYMV